MNREDIYSALFALVCTAPGLVTTSRKLKHWEDVQASEMPALFLAQAGQQALQRTGEPARWELSATIWLYVSTDGAVSPGQVANPIVDAITASLDLDPARGPQMLGGLAQYARIEGTIETSEGTLGTVEVLRIPVRMLVA